MTGVMNLRGQKIGLGGSQRGPSAAFCRRVSEWSGTGRTLVRVLVDKCGEYVVARGRDVKGCDTLVGGVMTRWAKYRLVVL